MKPICRHCGPADHWTPECPILNAFPSQGTPRVEADQDFLRRPNPPEKPPPKRRPLVPDGTVPFKTSQQAMVDLVNEKDAEIANLKRRIATAHTELAAAQTEIEDYRRQLAERNSVTTNPAPALPKTDPLPEKAGGRGRKKSGNAMTPAQKQAAYRARKRKGHHQALRGTE